MGALVRWMSALLLGAALITATARAGTVGSVTQLVLVDACTDQDLRVLVDDDEIDLLVDGSCISVRAETSGPIGSVRFGLDGDASHRTESAPPYALEGDDGGDYEPWPATLGAHRIEATPYSGSGASGTAGATLGIDLSVVEGSIELPPPTGGTGVVSGELRRWHRVTVDFVGPAVDEQTSPNPFRLFRMDVRFTHVGTGTVVDVPGFFAADGDAAESGASGGDVWRVRFAPPLTGTWGYVASFRGGTDAALSDDPLAGEATFFDGASGSFEVSGTNKEPPDHRYHGLLRHDGERYARFAGSGRWFLKGGADSPENLLAYVDFDGTEDAGGSANDLVDGLHRYAPHVADWSPGDPSWRGGLGKGLIGALNYLSSEGMNSVYFITMNVGGDGREVYPWTAYAERERFDVSKLAQWEIVFEHMDRVGIQLHLLMQETENDQLLDGGALGPLRRLYHRELVARFGHHAALQWNLGEENTNTDAQRKAFADHVRALDPYDHPIVVHSYPNQIDQVYVPLLGHPTLDGPSLQLGNMSATHAETLEWVQRSADAAHPWIVSLDEIGPASTGVKPDADDPDHDDVRRFALWGNLMAGGAGVEWYMGYSYPHNDLDCEDWRSRERMWEQTRHALDLFQQHLPFPAMTADDELTSATDDYVLALEGEIYAVYVPDATDPPALDLGGTTGGFEVLWYDPRDGGALEAGSVPSVTGGATRSLGAPPRETGEDWLVLVRRPLVPLFDDDFEGGTTARWSVTVP